MFTASALFPGSAASPHPVASSSRSTRPSKGLLSNSRPLPTLHRTASFTRRSAAPALSIVKPVRARGRKAPSVPPSSALQSRQRRQRSVVLFPHHKGIAEEDLFETSQRTSREGERKRNSENPRRDVVLPHSSKQDHVNLFVLSLC